MRSGGTITIYYVNLAACLTGHCDEKGMYKKKDEEEEEEKHVITKPPSLYILILHIDKRKRSIAILVLFFCLFLALSHLCMILDH